MDGINFDIGPVPESVSKRGVYLEETGIGILHKITENRDKQSDFDMRMAPSLEIPDEMAVPGTSMLLLLLWCSYFHNDGTPAPQRNVSIASVRGAAWRPALRPWICSANTY